MSSWMVVVMMVVSGAVMAFQAPINAALSRTLKGSLEASLVSFSVGTIALIILVALTREGSLGQVKSASWWQLLGGLIGAIFVTTTLLAAPKIGVQGMIVAALAGQMTAALLIDSFGWMGVTRKPVDLQRVAGLGLLVVSMALINWNSWKKA